MRHESALIIGHQGRIKSRGVPRFSVAYLLLASGDLGVIRGWSRVEMRRVGDGVP